MTNYWKHFFSTSILLLGLSITHSAQAASDGQLIRNIQIEGLKRTEAQTVLRELPFVEGDAWQADFAELGERRLRNLGIFSEAHITSPDANATVTIYIRERWSLWILPQASRRDDGSSSVSLVLDEYNLWGLNHHLKLGHKRDTGTNFTNLAGSSSEAAYHWARVADSKISLSAASSWGRSIFNAYSLGVRTAQYLDSSKSGSLTLSYALGPVPGEGWGASLGFSGTNSSYQLLAGTAQTDVTGHRLRAVTGGVSYRQINDHITWLTGSAFDYSMSVAHNAFGSTVDNYSHTASFRSYYPFWNENTINVRLNAGLVTGDILRAGLFDIGNRDGLRGYYPGELQGSHYLYGTVEGRFPLRQGSNFQLVTFADAGQIGGRVTSVTRGVAVGVGGGVRWTFRWLAKGTLRGDVAYGFSSKRWRFYLGTGQAF